MFDKFIATHAKDVYDELKKLKNIKEKLLSLEIFV